MNLIVPILLLILGLLLVAAEVFFPSMGILALMASASVGTAVVLAFLHVGVNAGIAFLLAVLVLVPLTLLMAFKLLPKTPLGKRLILAGPTFDETSGTAVTKGLESLVGREGKALSTLRPAGVASIDGKRVDVVTQGVMIEKGTPVKVARIEGNRVIVVPLPGSGKPEEKGGGGLLGEEGEGGPETGETDHGGNR